jgi:hypothetical protein
VVKTESFFYQSNHESELGERMGDGVLYEDEALVIRWKSGFLQDPDAFAPGEGIEHIYK